MRLNDEVRKISGLFMIMLVVGMILVTPAMACPAGKDCPNVSQNCPACGYLSAPKSDAEVNMIEISKEKEKKIIAEALSDERISKLNSELKKLGYTPSTSEFNASMLTTTTTNETVTSSIVIMPFDNGRKNESAVAVFTSNEHGSAAIAAMRNNSEVTLLEYDSVKGTFQVSSVDCDFCMWAVDKICGYLAEGGCAYACAQLATKIPHPAWMAVSAAFCWVICDFVLENYACSWSATTVCQEVGLC
ncbi:MAG: hypothetical protein GX152_12355 [Methanosarcina sp.]|uniref:Uncharacterized protein n=1 Tax=Methanosarcina flavescens TaxID=1715806 RepID=A0A660HU47_9EURY|nr:hypothetical protein [Methanosarcina flavescens]AYK15817.1 hypothetical protein AOB57_012020 [Methanosarcina flavescens]NLK31295.1 hypothetical protein [Methanosarcina flavescens]NLN44906.1 hypothetical protein [Methanosarcina sp.]